MSYMDYGHVGPLLLFFNQYFNNFLPEIYVLCIALIWCAYDLLVYCSQVGLNRNKKKARFNISLFLISTGLFGNMQSFGN